MVNSEKKKLTERQLEILTIVSEEGLSNAEIAEKLYLSENTVRNHMHRMFVRIGVFNRAEAVTYYFKNIKNAS